MVKGFQELREKAYGLWDKDPGLEPRDMCVRLEGKVKSGTVKTWKSRWRKQRAKGEQRATDVPSISWEQVLEAVPDTGVLGMILVDGFMRRFQEDYGKIEQLEKESQEKDNQIKELEYRLNDITEDRKKLMREYNELMAKVKTGGHYTIDKVRHRLIPKAS